MIVELNRLSKYISWFLALIPLFFLFSMIGFNRANADYFAYERTFYDVLYRSNFDFGYANLVDFIAFLGMDYRAIVFLVGLIFMLVLLKMLKTNNQINLVVFFYSIFPLIFDINQTRNTLMYLIVIFSLVYVAKRKQIKHYLVLFIAFSLHKLAILYIPFYYLCKIERKQFMRLLFLLTTILFISSPLIVGIVEQLLPEKMSFYLGNRLDFGVVMFWTLASIDYFTVWWVNKKVSPRLKEKDKNIMEVLYRFVWFPILTMPFIFYFSEIFRVQRNALLVKYIYCALAMRYMSVKEKFITIFLLLISVIAYAVGLLLYGDQLELFEFLNDNIIYYYLDKYLFY